MLSIVCRECIIIIIIKKVIMYLFKIMHKVSAWTLNKDLPNQILIPAEYPHNIYVCHAIIFNGK